MAEQQLLGFRCVGEVPLVSAHLICPPRRMTSELKSKGSRGELEGRGSINHLNACKLASAGSSYIYNVALKRESVSKRETGTEKKWHRD